MYVRHRFTDTVIPFPWQIRKGVKNNIKGYYRIEAEEGAVGTLSNVCKSTVCIEFIK